MDLQSLFILAWLAQAIGFGIAGDEKRCGMGRAFMMAAICGPFAALAYTIGSERKPPMP